MVETVIIVGIACLVASMIGAMLAIKLQQNYIQRLQRQNEAWERAQESHQQRWEQQQSKRIAELETNLANWIQELQEVWAAWAAKDAERIESLAKQHEAGEAQWRIKREIARLPRIEDTPLADDAAHPHQHVLPNWQPPMLQGADLSGRDLSHRYIGHADLRNAQLMNTNFFMSDLSGASLTGANLTGADLSGANLSSTDLRGAILTNANLHVADLHEAILVEADLLTARHLTTQQIYAAYYDGTTKLDAAIDITKPRLRSVRPAPSAESTESTEPKAVSAEETVVLVPPMASSPIAAALPPTPAFMEILETPRPSLLPDIEFLMPEEDADVRFSTPRALSDSLLDLKVTDLLVDTQENRHTAKSGTTIPN